MSLALNQLAPAATVFRGDGTPVALHDYWATRPVILVFLRHYGCQFCREWLTILRSKYPDIVERGAAVIAVAQGDPLQAAHFVNQFRIPFPLLADPLRQAFQAYGLSAGSLAQTIGPRVIRQMVGTGIQGYLPGVTEHVRIMTGKDSASLRQLGGTFVVGQGGMLRYAQVGTPIYKHPPLDELWAALANEAQTIAS